MLVCYCGERVISARVTLRNLVREMTDVESVDDVEADGEEARRSQQKVKLAAGGPAERRHDHCATEPEQTVPVMSCCLKESL